MPGMAIELGRRLISPQPQPQRGELDHSEKIGGEPVVACGDAAEVLQLGEEPLDQIALAVEPLAEAGLPAPVALGRDVRGGNQFTDAVGIVGLVRQRYQSANAPFSPFIDKLSVQSREQVHTSRSGQ
jgi:hypothetical protein